MAPCLEDGVILYETGVTHSEIRNILHKFWYAAEIVQDSGKKNKIRRTQLYHWLVRTVFSPLTDSY